MNKEINLALGGGAVLGAAHVGVIRALLEEDHQVKHIAGTSIGAFVGALMAFDKTLEEIEEIASDLKWMDISGMTLSKYGLLSNEKLGELIKEHIGDKKIEDASIPLALVTTNIESGEKVVLTKGSLAEGIMASTAIPGIFTPVEIDGQLLLDGGIVENVPVKTVQDMSNDFCIAIDLNSKHEYERPDNIIEVIINSLHFLMQKSDAMQGERADLLIKPNLSEFNRSDMDQIDQLIKKGYEYTKNLLKTSSVSDEIGFD